jgi:hypothetical protein
VLDLLALADRDLKSAKARGLDDDWRFNIAYNAALQAGTAALVASGYNVPKGDSHHFRVIGSLAFTIGLDRKQIDKLDHYRKKRSMTIYDIAGAITAEEAKAMQSIAQDLVEQVHAWLVENHSSLMKPPK